MNKDSQNIAILCVDDEEVILKSLRRQLREICPKAKIEVAQSSATALTLLNRRHESQSPYAIMIVDHIMPGMKGDELLKQATSISPHTYQIMLTGHIDGETVGQLVNHARLFRFLSKPWSVGELSIAIHSAVDSFQRDNDLREQQRTNQQLTHQLRQSQKMEILENLSGEIAHDFNNLLSVVALGADSLKEDLTLIGEESTESTFHHLVLDSLTTVKDISFACLHAGKLTKQLLSLSRDIAQEKEPFNAAKCTQDTITLLTRLMPEGVQLHYTQPDESLMILGNENAFQQVIMNLVINAKDAIDQTGQIEVSLTIDQHVQTQHCMAGTLSEGKYIHLCVKDTGDGIPIQLLSHIFEPFVSSKGNEGTGLGLSIVYNIVVKSFQGAINAKSEETTQFDVYIPLLEILEITP